MEDGFLREGSGIRRNETPEAVAVRTHPTRHHHFASVLFDQTEWLQNRTRARRAFTFQVRIQLVTMQCMGDILTEKQKAERLAEGASMSFALLFPCPQCGHANRPARTKLQSVRLYLLDQLPPCRRCGSALRRASFPRSAIPAGLLKRAEAALPKERVIECANCAQKLRPPADRRKVKLRCPKCKAEFDYLP